MCGEQGQIRFRASPHGREAGVVLAYPLSVERGESFQRPQDERRAPSPTDAAGVIEGVTGVQQPPVARVDRYGGVTASVTGQRDQDNPGRYLIQRLHRCEATPRFSRRTMFDDSWTMPPLCGAKPTSLAPGRWVLRTEHLIGGGVNSRVREVGEAADVVGVEVGDDDMPYVVTSETEPFDLTGGCLRRIEYGPHDVPYRTYPALGVGDVAETIAGVDEDQAVVGLDK